MHRHEWAEPHTLQTQFTPACTTWPSPLPCEIPDLPDLPTLPPTPATGPRSPAEDRHTQSYRYLVSSQNDWFGRADGSTILDCRKPIGHYLCTTTTGRCDYIQISYIPILLKPHLETERRVTAMSQASKHCMHSLFNCQARTRIHAHISRLVAQCKGVSNQDFIQDFGGGGLVKVYGTV